MTIPVHFSNDDAITDMMGPLMTFVVEFSKSPAGSQFGKEIYDGYGRYLFREMEDKKYVSTGIF